MSHLTRRISRSSSICVRFFFMTMDLLSGCRKMYFRRTKDIFGLGRSEASLNRTPRRFRVESGGGPSSWTCRWSTSGRKFCQTFILPTFSTSTEQVIILIITLKSGKHNYKITFLDPVINDFQKVVRLFPVAERVNVGWDGVVIQEKLIFVADVAGPCKKRNIIGFSWNKKKTIEILQEFQLQIIGHLFMLQLPCWHVGTSSIWQRSIFESGQAKTGNGGNWGLG